MTSVRNPSLRTKIMTSFPEIKSRSNTYNNALTQNQSKKQSYGFVTPARHVLYKNSNLVIGTSKVNPLYNPQAIPQNIQAVRSQLVHNAWNVVKVAAVKYPKITHEGEEQLLSPTQRMQQFSKQVEDIHTYRSAQEEWKLMQKRQRILTNEYLSVPDLHETIQTQENMSGDQKYVVK